MTTQERRASFLGLLSWALYDWANSAFPAVIQTFVFAAYFVRQVAADEVAGSGLWGFTTGMAGIVIAVGAPVLGAIADQHGCRKRWIAFFTLLCVVTTTLLWTIAPSTQYVTLAMVLMALGTLGSEFAFVFYNAMLPDIAPADRVGRWSGWGWALGYAGGVVCLTIALVVFVKGDTSWLGLDRSAAQHMRVIFPFSALWYLVFAVPLFLFTPDLPSTGKTLAQATRLGCAQLIQSIRHVRQYGPLVRFLVARMIYINGLATLFAFGGIYAAGAFDMNEYDVLLFGIALNVTAGIGAALFAVIDDVVGGKRMILFALVCLIISASAILIVESRTLFWVFGMLVGVFVGPVQASSRSFLARVAPPALRNEIFGFYALSGKATAFLGPLLVGGITVATKSQRLGLSVIVIFLAVGALLMLTVPSEERCRNMIKQPPRGGPR